MHRHGCMVPEHSIMGVNGVPRGRPQEVGRGKSVRAASLSLPAYRFFGGKPSMEPGSRSGSANCEAILHSLTI